MRLLSTLFVLVILAAPAGAQRFPAEGFADLAEELSPAVVNISAAQRIGAGDSGMPDFPEGSPLERFNELFGDAPRIAGVLARAAAPGSGPQGRRIAAEGQVHAHDLVAGGNGSGGGHGGVHSPAHRGEHSHDALTPARARPRPATRAR